MLVEPGLNDWGSLRVADPSTIPAEPGSDSFYHHRARLIPSLRRLWASREIVLTLAERDFRAQYKQATLGIAWALLSPVLTLLILMVVFSREKTFGTEHLPIGLYMYTGILCWSFFASALGNGGNSLLINKQLLNKTQFPRECFPLETMALAGINTVLSWIPLAILFVVYGRAPALTTLWAPMLMVIEVLFAAGVTLLIAGIIIQMRDLMQVLPIIISLGLFIEPVIWPLTKLQSTATNHVPAWVLPVYSFLNPLGPVIDSVRRTMLLGLSPDWPLMGLAALGAVTYLFVGYKVFKRLEVVFADIA